MLESKLPKALNRKVTKETHLLRIKLLEQLEKEDIPGGKSQLQYYFETREKLYPIFAGIEIKDYLELQNILSDIDPERIWKMDKFIKFIIKWFIAYYSEETENPPFIKIKSRLLTKKLEKFNEMFEEFMEE